MLQLSDLQKLYDKIKSKALEDYKTFLKFPSISSEPGKSKTLKSCSDWLANYLEESGLKVDIWNEEGAPIVFAAYQDAGPDKPTLLLYHHYDVQPVEPLDEWNHPPFDPTIIDGEVYARGAQDNKGQCFYSLLAVTSLLKEYKTLPINVKIIIEGEEEIGSPSLPEWLEKKKEALKADYLAIVDVGMRGKNSPAVTLGVRGMVTMEVIAKGTKTDLHSGTHGGIAFNPLHALVQILAQLRDSSTGKITIPDFYDDVKALTDEEKKVFSLDFPDDEYVRMFKQKPTGGEKEYSLSERAWLRPTLEINGIAGGYAGEGFKTVIPAKALAKISCRLVPGQDPEIIGKKVADHIENSAPEGIDISVNINPGMGSPLRTDPHSVIANSFAQSFQEVFGNPAEFILEGASIPISAKLAEASGGQPVFVGLGLVDDQIHAPNEHFGLDRIEKGYLSIGRVLAILGEKNRS